MASYYDLLGVDADAAADEVRRAYHRKAQQLHPDRYEAASEPERRWAEAEMKALNEAWQTLKSPEARRRYDVSLRLAEAGPGAVEVWGDGEEYAGAPRFFGRAGVRMAVVSLILLGFLGSAVAAVVFAITGSGSEPGGTQWTPAAEQELRTAAVNAGFTFTEADCFVEYVTSRYSPDDSVDVSVVEEAAGACR